MPQANETESNKRKAQEAITREHGSLPFYLPGLLSVIPTYFVGQMLRSDGIQDIDYVIILAIYFGFSYLLGLCLRVFRDKHPAHSKWHLLIR